MAAENGQISIFARALARFFGEQPMQAMVVARVALGLVLFFAYATKFRYVQTLYGPEGIGGLAMHQRVPDALAGRPLLRMRSERPVQRTPTYQRSADQFDLNDKGNPSEPFGMEHESDDVEAHEYQTDYQSLNTVRCSNQTTK